MTKITKSILKVIGIYIGYLIFNIIVFYITGMYIWPTPPTKLVLTRILVFPIFLTITTIVFSLIVKKLKNTNKK